MGNIIAENKTLKKQPADAGPVVQDINDKKLMDRMNPDQQLKVQQSASAKQAFENPLRANTVDMSETVNLSMPKVQDVEDAFREVESEFSDSTWKRKWKLKDARGKYDLQKKLRDKETAGIMPAASKIKKISPEKAVSLSDKGLIAHYKEYSTGDSYLDARFALIKNKYYALLPEAGIKKMGRRQMVLKIRSLYSEDPRNDELIRYFQNMVTIRDYEESIKKDSEPAVTPAVKTLPSATKLKKLNGASAEKAEKYIKLVTKDTKEQKDRIAVMRSVMTPAKAEKAWRADKDDLVNASQKEGIREILAWMYRNCLKTYESKEPFVYKLTQAEPERLLLMFYLIENDMHETPTTAVMASAMEDYVPDLDSFKGKVVASKAKFWKRLRPSASDSVIDWAKMGATARFVLGNEALGEHITYAKEVKAIEAEISKPENSADIKIRDLLIDGINKKGNLLITLYRNAGITKDMPLNLVEDPKMRKLITDTYKSFASDVNRLADVLKRTGVDDRAALAEKSKYNAGDGKDDKGAEGPDDLDDSAGMAEKLQAGVDVGASPDSIITALGDLAEDISVEDVYVKSFGGLGAVSAVLGLIAAVGNVYEIINGASAMSTADHISQAVSVSGAMIEETAGLVQSGANIAGTFVDLGETGSSTWLMENTVVRTAEDAFSTVAGGIEFCTGCVTIAAGVLKTAGSAINLARGVSSRRDILRSRKQLEKAKKEANLTEEQKRDHEVLERFLSHGKRTAKGQMRSAAADMASGTLLMLGGVLTVSGILAPLGGAIALIGTGIDIGYGLIGARLLKKRTRKKAVDEALKVDSLMNQLKGVSADAKKMSDGDLREAIRQDLLGALGYVNYKEYFAHICHESAEILYKHVFIMDPADKEYPMYLDALKSLGTKIHIPKNKNEKPLPTVETIYSKMME